MDNNINQAFPGESNNHNNHHQHHQVYGSNGPAPQQQPQWGAAAQTPQPPPHQPNQSYDPVSKACQQFQQGINAAVPLGGYPQQQGNIYHQQQGQFNRPPPPPPSQDFKAELFGCFEECYPCLEGWLCAYCQVAAQFNMVENNESGIYWPVCLGAYWLDACFGGSGVALCVLTMIVRGKIRARYNIQPGGGKECEDCLLSIFCRCCVVTQQFREMTSRGEFPGGLIVNPPAVTYTQMGGGGGGPVYQNGGGNQQSPLLNK